MRYLILHFLVIIFCSPFTYSCNRYAALCNRRFNEFCQINAHNASSNTPSPVQDQDRTLTQQMNDGITATKLPIHKDYVYVLAYYHDMIVAYLSILRERRDRLAASAREDRDQPIGDIETAQQKVSNLNQRIAELDRQIAEKQNWYNNLSVWDKIVQSIPFGASMGAFHTEKLSLEAALNIAMSVLEAAKQGLQSIPVKVSPEIVALDAQIALVDSIRNHIIDRGGPDTFKRALFACHGLYKNELYSDHISGLLDNMPENIRSVLEPLKNKLKQEVPNIITKLYGPREQAGGIIPYTPCLIDSSSILLLLVLVEIKNFLDSNPKAIFTLTIEDATGGNWTDYEEVFNKSGIMHYAHAQNRNAPWPTLGEMIAAGKRLVVFAYGDPGNQYPWINSFNYFCPWSNKWDYKTAEELLNSDPATTIRNSSYRDNTPPFNKLFDVPHQVTPGFAGDKKMAAIVNARSNFRKRMLRHMEVAQHIVNIASVDFYEYPSTDGVPDVIDVCDEINGVGKYEGKPLWKPSPVS